MHCLCMSYLSHALCIGHTVHTYIHHMPVLCMRVYIYKYIICTYIHKNCPMKTKGFSCVCSGPEYGLGLLFSRTPEFGILCHSFIHSTPHCMQHAAKVTPENGLRSTTTSQPENKQPLQLLTIIQLLGWSSCQA